MCPTPFLSMWYKGVMDTTFSRIDIKHGTKSAGKRGKPSHYARPGDRMVTTPNNLEVWKALCQLPDGELRDLVKRCWAEDKDDYITQFGKLSRELKRIDPRANAGAYYGVVKVWHFLNGHHVKGRSLGSVLAEFSDYWNMLAGPDKANQYMIDHVRDSVNLNHDDASRKVHDTLLAFAKLFRSRQYFCSVRTIAEAVKLSKSTVQRHLAALEERGAIRRYTRGGPHLYKRKADVINVSPSYAISDYMADRDQRQGEPKTSASFQRDVYSACVPHETGEWWLSDGEAWEQDADVVELPSGIDVDGGEVSPQVMEMAFGRDYDKPPPMNDVPVDF